MTTNGHQTGGTPNGTVGFIEGRARCVDRAEYLLNLQLELLNLALGISRARRVHPPPESSLDFMHGPGVVWEGEQTGPKLIDTPFQTRDIIRIPFLDCGLQRLAYAETVIGHLYECIVVNLLVLVGPLTNSRVHRWRGSESTNPNQS